MAHSHVILKAVNTKNDEGFIALSYSARDSTADNLLVACDEHFSIDGRMLVD